MNWDDLRYFLATARFGTLTVAATRLGVDQATVGRRIAQLEAHMTAKLFDKSPRGYELTAAGRRLLEIAENISAHVEEAQEFMTSDAKQLSGAIRIGAPDGVASHLVSGGALELARGNPQLDVQLVALPRVFSLSKREVDFAVAVSRPSTGRLKVRKISDFSLHIYGSRSYVKKHPTESIKDLKYRRGIGYIPDLIFDRELDYIPLIDPTLSPHLTSTSVHVQLEWVKSSAGLCILPDFIATRHRDLVRVLEDEVNFVRSFWLVVHEDNARHIRIRRCADVICESIVGTLAKRAE